MTDTLFTLSHARASDPATNMKHSTSLNQRDDRDAYAAELRRFADRGEMPDLYAVADYLENAGLEEIGDLEDEIETLKADLESEENSVRELDAEVNTLQLALDNANDKLDKLDDEIRELKERTTTP